MSFHFDDTYYWWLIAMGKTLIECTDWIGCCHRCQLINDYVSESQESFVLQPISDEAESPHHTVSYSGVKWAIQDVGSFYLVDTWLNSDIEMITYRIWIQVAQVAVLGHWHWPNSEIKCNHNYTSAPMMSWKRLNLKDLTLNWTAWLKTILENKAQMHWTLE